jgi:hypothetical protein
VKWADLPAAAVMFSNGETKPGSRLVTKIKSTKSNQNWGSPNLGDVFILGSSLMSNTVKPILTTTSEQQRPACQQRLAWINDDQHESQSPLVFLRPPLCNDHLFRSWSLYKGLTDDSKKGNWYSGSRCSMGSLWDKDKLIPITDW